MQFAALGKGKNSLGTDHQHRTYLMFALVILAVLMTQNAMAFSVPTSGSLGYDVYDLVVNQFLKGAVGFVVAIGLIVAAVFALVRMMIPAAVLCFIAATLLFSAPALVQSFGCLIV